MATTARQAKPPRKGPDPNARRPPTGAWSGQRSSPTFSPGPANARLPNGNQQGPPSAFPPLANGGARPAPVDANHTRILTQISGLTGTTVTISTKTNTRIEGVVLSTQAEGDTTGVTLKDAKEVTNPGAPLKETFFIAATNIQEWSSGPADAKIPNGADSFKTDTDISKTGPRQERQLQAWQPDSGDAATAAAGAVSTRNLDEVTFGPGASGGSWDQFAVNEERFGVKLRFDEEVYTTKLDRSAPDFKERERKAQQVANEIMSSTTTNVHIAEERVMNLTGDGSGANEEDKYGAVVRGANAYVPPGARGKSQGPATTPPAKSEVPKVAVNAPDGTSVTPSGTTASTPSASKVPSPAPGATGTAKPVDAFRSFVSNEKDRLIKKKQALMKSEMDRRLSDLVSFSKSFKLNKPIPDDLVPILAKDEDKQKQIKEKSSKDAEDSRARSIGVLSTLAAAPGVRNVPVAGSKGDTSRAVPSKQSSTASAMQKTSTAPGKPGDGSKKIPMVIQTIPPFKGKRTSTAAAPTLQVAAGVAPAPASNGSAKPPASPLSPAAQNRLNVNASSFRPIKPFSPGGGSGANGATSSSTPTNKQQSENSSPQGPPNPFFGTRSLKKTPLVHVKDDFNPFKHHKVIEAAQVAPSWPFNGKRYMHVFPPMQAQPQQQSPPMAPPGPPGPPPPMPQEQYQQEDPAAQAARAGYVYAYPPYAYPGQMVPQMMPGMGPPPPGAYIPGPYMQPMHYPMPPPNGMYPHGQMPPPQAYMQPPPGAYPPPPQPNGGGPRPSMPPTPIPAHAHPYYHHQSPQLQHAMPYPMMMPPPGSVPPHGYDPNQQPPPVPMGGVSHA
ncbi:uncharacterized protein BXZ73DRAFT_96444 [Epithele typhae]|uniref:uncharacterized protein n=1 Tax=Epithele typhae TaxID=378194 RepID=UPI00200883A2|nr:uncharacterized protein BXZ73DRAFT_96444 [Epithele typhae]KAH9945455.1 hypothetical protein BXZ73DRAFT_96444 [Epithele typhae]